eukprot:4662879-Pyramimonas_sp.AAC.1
MTALAMVARARREQTALPPNVLASALRDMSRLPDHPFGELEVGPRAMAKRARTEGIGADSFECHATWTEFAGWKRSAGQCASAVQLWGEAAALASVPPWPPSHAAVNAFCTLFRSSASLG